MAHVVETGAGLADANSYLSAADADAYFVDHGAPAAWTGLAAVKEQALRLATQYLDAVYGARWKGQAMLQTQALDWPRHSACSVNGWTYASDDLPAALEHACAELAVRSLAGDTLLPDLAPGSTVGLTAKSVTAGSVSVSKTFGGVTSPYKKYTLIDKLLADLFYSQYAVERG
jgi:hypothetical protein